MTRTNVLKTLVLAGAVGCMCPGRAADRPAEKPDAPLACNLKALTPSQRTRHQQLGRLWPSAVLDRLELSDGYEFRIDPSKTSIVELAEWIGYEHKCCPFLRFRIEANEVADLSMSLSGRPGVKKFVEADFPR